jgi:hypothetical protein
MAQLVRARRQMSTFTDRTLVVSGGDDPILDIFVDKP